MQGGRADVASAIAAELGTAHMMFEAADPAAWAHASVCDRSALLVPTGVQVVEQPPALSGREGDQMLRLKRVYEPAAPDDGYRVLVERLWPRGVSKERARLDAWAKALAPSDALRRWYGHDPERWDEFRARYRRELEEPERRAALAELAERARRQTVTLVYASKAGEISNAAALKAFLDSGELPPSGAT